MAPKSRLAGYPWYIQTGKLSTCMLNWSFLYMSLPPNILTIEDLCHIFCTGHIDNFCLLHQPHGHLTTCTSPIKTSLSAQLLGTERPPYLPAIYPYRCLSTCPLYWRYTWLAVCPLHLVCYSYVVVPCCTWLTNFLLSPRVSFSNTTQVNAVTWPVCYTLQHSCVIFRWHIYNLLTVQCNSFYLCVMK